MALAPLRRATHFLRMVAARTKRIKNATKRAKSAIAARRARSVTRCTSFVRMAKQRNE